VGSIRQLPRATFEIRAYVGQSDSGVPRFVQATYTHPRPDGGIQEAQRRLRGLEAKNQ